MKHPDCTCRDCKPGGVSHHWALRMGPREEARCWCQPFRWDAAACIERDGTLVLGVLHRPSETIYGFVFHEHGEQGPMSEDCVILTNPVLDDLDDIAFTEDRPDLGLVIGGVNVGRDEIARPWGASEDGE